MTELDDDIIDRLDRAAERIEQAALLAEEDRQQISRLITLVQRLTVQGEVTLHSAQRLESNASIVAEDLAASNARADEAPWETAGAGADAALRSARTIPPRVAAHEGT